MRVHFDTTPMIFLVEKTAPFEAALHIRIAQPGYSIVVSDLVRMECLVKPYRNGDFRLVGEFQSFIDTCELVPLDRTVYEEAAAIRARHGIKTPDAINLAAATVHGCDRFLTRDAALVKYTGIPVELI